MTSILRKITHRKASLDETECSEKKKTEHHVKLVERDPDSPKIILLPAENCSHCEFTFKWYYDNIHRPGNQVVIVYVIELPEQKSNSKQSSGKMNHPLGGMHISPKTLQELWKKEEERTVELEQTMRRLLKEKKCTGVLRTAAGKPGPTICKVALEEGATMVVTGSRNLGRMKRVLIGSVSDYLVHHTHCPVVVCRLPTLQKSLSLSGTEVRQRHFSDSAMLSKEGKLKKASFIQRMRHKSAGQRPLPASEMFDEEKENAV